MTQPSHTQEELTEINEWIEADFVRFAEHCLKIKPKDKAIIPFILNESQLYAHALLEAQLKRKGYVRARILKARQPGMSTLVEGRFYWKTTTIQGSEVMIMTEADKSLGNIFEMVKRYNDHCPKPFKPNTKNTNEKALIFDSGSRYDVMTCKSIGGKGVTKHYVHKSEVAYYPESTKATIAGFMESIPSEYPGILGTEVIEETTANGAGDDFHVSWKETEEEWKEYLRNGKKGREPEYINIFVPWFYHVNYSLEMDDYDLNKLKQTITDHEKWLLRQKRLDGKGVTYEQLAWRRWKIPQMNPSVGMTKAEYFPQWYPASSEEAFIAGGSRVFPADYVRAAERECYPSKIVCELELSTGLIKEIPGGRLSIWDKPRIGKEYVIGADVAEGLEKGDYSCADVLEVPGGRQVAQFRGHIDPDIYGTMLYYLARLYNDALLGVEANNHGFTVLAELGRRVYPNLYMRETLDGAVGKKVKKFGWLTTAKSKNTIIDQLTAVLREGDSGIVCQDTIDELDTFLILKAGESDGDKSQMGAKPAHFDDRVMSYAIALHMLLNNSGIRAERESSKWPKRGD